MRAWIEINRAYRRKQSDFVALFMRAWIEIICAERLAVARRVALFMRAWIEMKKHTERFCVRKCRPLHEGVD